MGLDLMIGLDLLDASIAVAVDYNSSHIQLLLDNESVTVI
jgi:hypothetical protein